jgi:alpha-beta hydrolase superfamily lysophospholipase
MNPAIGTAAPISMEVRLDKHTVLPGQVWCADRPRALVAIAHGLGEHSGRYAALASDLVRARFTVAAFDLPGHGDTAGPRGDMTSWLHVRDHVVPAMFTASRGMPGQPTNLPHVLLGHSMGGVLALDFALAHPKALHALIVSAPGLKSATPPWWKLALAQAARVAAPSAGFPHGLPVSALSRDAEVVKAYQDDPRVHDKISPRLFFAFEEARARVMRDARRLAVPTLLFQGMADRMIDPKGTLEFAGLCPHGMVRFETLGDTYHEIFNDLGREKVVKHMVDWLDAALVV